MQFLSLSLPLTGKPVLTLCRSVLSVMSARATSKEIAASGLHETIHITKVVAGTCSLG